MSKALRVAMLLTDGYGSSGGIAKFNRDFLAALDASPAVALVHALPRLIPEPIGEEIPGKIVYDRRAARGKVAYMQRVAAHAIVGHGLDLVVCGHLHLLPAAWSLARSKGVRLVLIVHGVDAWTPTAHPIANWLAYSVDGLIAVSQYSAERFFAWSKAPLKLKPPFILPNCVDLDVFVPQDRDPSLMDRYGLRSCKVLLTVCRLAPDERYKGVDEVMQAMPKLLERYPDLKYLVVGDGGDRARLEAKAGSLQLNGKVVFAGHVSESEKVAHYNLADVFVMPSWGEGFGIVYIEAAACGIPAIGANSGGAPEALLNGRLGQLVDPANSVDLIEAIGSSLESGARGVRNPLVETYSTTAYRRRLDDWCHRLADERDCETAAYE